MAVTDLKRSKPGAGGPQGAKRARPVGVATAKSVEPCCTRILTDAAAAQ
ncbi:hypothetical protein [Jiella sonneratiae]|uniref:Uncharacterized protein n=1 Tax=Jiella sonneratiae TaxID=2816856 RepID=A0ABS3JAX5_9HYPH|nr:hypothetical protein [Jiella sonneratiae]MBO0906113.1 hypothetical protein [Jiella sonneratiae]